MGDENRVECPFCGKETTQATATATTVGGFCQITNI